MRQYGRVESGATISEGERRWLRVLGALNEAQARLFVAERALEMGRGGISRLSKLTGMSRLTIYKSAAELRGKGRLVVAEAGRIRRAGGGRKRVEEVAPGIRRELTRIVEESTAGDPMSLLKWTSKSTRTMAEELTRRGHPVRAVTVGRCLHEMGYSLQALRRQVRERLMAQPPDHVLVVENEPGLRQILEAEIREYLGWSVDSCSFEAFAGEPAFTIGAQIVAANHLVGEIKPLVPRSRPAIGLVYARPTEHVDLVRKLRNPSIVAVVSGSESLLRTARGLLAPAIGMRHTFSKVFADPDAAIRLGSADLVFCDTVTYSRVHFRRKILYRLIAPECLELVAASLSQN